MKLGLNEDDGSDPEGTLTGTEPWHLATILKRFPTRERHPNDVWLASAEKLASLGPSKLEMDHRAFWHSYMSLAKCPLPSMDPVPLDKDAILKAFEEATPDLPALTEAMEKAAQGLVMRQDDVGFFARVAPTRVTALPDWCRAAVVVNTKTPTFELISCGHHLSLDLNLITSHFDGSWQGHRYRARSRALPSMTDLTMAFNLLRAGTSTRPQR